jgi:hypothetical protein
LLGGELGEDGEVLGRDHGKTRNAKREPLEEGDFGMGDAGVWGRCLARWGQWQLAVG